LRKSILLIGHTTQAVPEPNTSFNCVEGGREGRKEGGTEGGREGSRKGRKEGKISTLVFAGNSIKQHLY